MLNNVQVNNNNATINNNSVIDKNNICYVNNVKVLYTNVRSLTSGTKREELKMLIDQENIDIIGITETWGKPTIMDTEMEIPGFKLYRKDRAAVKAKIGGWVALYIKNTLQSVECEE